METSSQEKKVGKLLQENHLIGTNEGYTLDLKKEEMSLCSKLEEREKQEEIIWRKKYQNRWLKEG